MYYLPLIAAEKVLTGTEKMNGGQITAMTIVGLLVVFSALLILVAFLYGSGSLFKKMESKPKAQKKPAAPQKTAPAAKKPAERPQKAAAVQKPPAPAAPAEDDTEVIAVIMAAIAAMGAAEGKTYQLKSVRAVEGRASARARWAQAGLIDRTRPF